jgi:hypothetical protein
MEKFQVKEDINTFGVHVTTFPAGVGEAFEKLSKELENGMHRPWYGISWMDDKGKVVYYANSAEISPNEAAKYKYETLLIEKGEYYCEPVKNWRSNLDCIKDVFHDMMESGKTDSNKPCIEWYKSDDEMLCLIKAK